MKQIISILLIVLSVSGFAQTKVDRSKAPAPAPAPAIQIGQYKLFTLDNGLKVIVVENHKLPRVSYSITVDVDPVLEGPKAGFLSFAGELLSAGTSTRSKAQIDESIDYIGASLSTSSTNVFGSCLVKHSEQLLSIMSDVILNPSFPEEELEKVRKRALSALAAEKTDPGAISDKIGNLVRYGKDHPYGEFTTEETLGAITRDDLVRYYQSHFRPNVAYLVIVGDITPEKALEQATTYFGSWQRGNVSDHVYPQPKAPARNEVAFVPMPGAVQSVIEVTYPISLMPGTQDAITASVLNNILGGSGFQTRLMQNLREDKAYTYGAYSYTEADEVVGVFGAGCSVRNEVTDSSITQILLEMQLLVDGLVPDSTLQSVKNIMTGSFARSLEQPQTIARFALNIERFKLPKDYYETYLQKLNAITAEDIQNAARRFLRPSNAWITVVGNKDIAEKLKVFNPDGAIQMFTPEGNVYKELKPAPAGITTDVVLRAYIQAIGGEKKLAKVKNMEQTGTMTIGPMALTTSTAIFNKSKLRMVVKMGENEVIRQVFDGTKLVMTQMGQNTPVDDGDILQVRTQVDLLSELHYAQYNISAELKGMDVINGKDVYVVEVQMPNGDMNTDYYSVETGLRVKSVSVTKGATGESEITEIIYEDYLTTKEGLRFPSKQTITSGGQQFTLETKNVNTKAKLKAADFEIQ